MTSYPAILQQIEELNEEIQGLISTVDALCAERLVLREALEKIARQDLQAIAINALSVTDFSRSPRVPPAPEDNS